jgi:hypothetical protein
MERQSQNIRNYINGKLASIVNACDVIEKIACAATVSFSSAGVLCGIFHEASAALNPLADLEVPETGLSLFTDLAYPRLLLAAIASLGVLMAASAIGHAARESRENDTSYRPR